MSSLSACSWLGDISCTQASSAMDWCTLQESDTDFHKCNPSQIDKFPLIKILCISIQQGSSGPREAWSNDRLQWSLIKIFIYMNFKVFRLLEKPMKMYFFFNSIGPDLMILSNCHLLKLSPGPITWLHSFLNLYKRETITPKVTINVMHLARVLFFVFLPTEWLVSLNHNLLLS